MNLSVLIVEIRLMCKTLNRRMHRKAANASLL